MKKITFLLLTIIPLISVAQITNGTFDSDASGWNENNSTITWNMTEGSAAAGSLQLVTTDVNGRAQSTPNSAPTDGPGEYTFSFKVKGTAGNKVQGSVFQNGSGTTGGTVLTLTGGWDTYTATFPGLTGSNTNLRLIGKEAGATYYFDDVEFISSTPIMSTYNGFVQNPDFEDVSNAITPWEVTGNGTGDVSTDASTGTQAAEVVITGGGNVFLENGGYTLPFGSPQTIAATGDKVVITWDMKSNSTAIEVSGKFTLGGATNQNLFTGKKSVAVADTYESFSVTKPLDAQMGNVYDDISSLEFRIQSGAVSDYVIIDNVTTNYTINGVTLSVKNNQLDSFSVFPNPAKDVVYIKGNVEVKSVVMYDITGKKVLSNNNLVNDTLDVSSLNSGLYLLRIQDVKGSVSTKKVMVD